MAITHFDSKSFDEAIASGTTLVDFWATWCGPCRMQAPILDAFDAEMGDVVKVGKVDVDEQPDIAARFNIFSIKLDKRVELFYNSQYLRGRAGVRIFFSSERKRLVKVSGKRCGRSARSICREVMSAADGSPRYRSKSAARFRAEFRWYRGILSP